MRREKGGAFSDGADDPRLLWIARGFLIVRLPSATGRYFAGADSGLPLSTTYVPINVVLTDPVLRPL